MSMICHKCGGLLDDFGYHISDVGGKSKQCRNRINPNYYINKSSNIPKVETPTLRDRFAMHIQPSPNMRFNSVQEEVEWRYNMADAMMAARAKNEKGE